MIRSWLTISALTIQLCVLTPAYARQLDMPGTDALVAEALKQWNVPGAAVVVVERGRVMYLKGHGVRKHGQPGPVTTETIFPIASCTKAFTSTLTAMLIDDGVMHWDDPVRKHLPDFRLSDPLANDGVVVRDLLCHRTGLGSHDELWYASGWPVAEQVRRCGLLPPIHPFRSMFQYQSVIYSAAGLACGKALGKSWDELIQARIFDPLGMRTAKCIQHGSDVAEPHQLTANGIVPMRRFMQLEPNPAGSIHLSARDLAPWLLFQLGDGTWQDKRLISKLNLTETHTPQLVQRLEGLAAATHPESNLLAYGLGWVIQDYRGTLLWSHTGVIDGFRAQIAIAPKRGFAVAVMSNCHETRMNLALVNDILDRLTGPARRDWNGYLKAIVAKESQAVQRAKTDGEQKLKVPSSLATDQLPGVYEHPAYGECEVERDGETLIWKWRENRLPMRWDTREEYHLDWPVLRDPDVAFEVANGKVVSMTLFQVRWRRK